MVADRVGHHDLAAIVLAMSAFGIGYLVAMHVGIAIIVASFIGASGRNPILKVLAGIAVFGISDVLFLASLIGWIA